MLARQPLGFLGAWPMPPEVITVSAPRSHLLARPGLRALPALSLRASGWHPPPFAMTYSANRADVHCLGVVASVEQALSLQQHGEARLEEAGREEKSVRWAPGREAEVICKHTWLTAERDLLTPSTLWGSHRVQTTLASPWNYRARASSRG